MSWTVADLDPWSDNTSHTTPSAASSSRSSFQQLESRKPNPSLSVNSHPNPVVRHPLRSPSPVANTSSSTNQNATPNGVASEWKQVSAGIAGLFSFKNEHKYRWPHDPVGSTSDLTHRRNRFPNSTESTLPPTSLDPSVQQSMTQDDYDGGSTKGHRANPIETTLDRLEDWFGLKEEGSINNNNNNNPGSASHRSISSSSSNPVIKKSEPNQIRVLIHPVAPTDTLSSLAVHYGADIPTLRKSNKLWPGDAVQMRNVIYIPIDHCKHRPPNAEIKLISTNDSRQPSESLAAQTSSPNLAFVSKEEQQEVAPIYDEPSDLSFSFHQPPLIPDLVSDFMPETNKTYSAEQTSLPPPSIVRATNHSTSASLRGSSSNGASPKPANHAPLPTADHVNLGSTATASSFTLSNTDPHSKPASTISETASNAASASAASSGFVPPRGPIAVTKVSADKLKFFIKSPSDKKDGTDATPVLGKGPGDAGYVPGESGLDDLLALMRTTDACGSSSAGPPTMVATVNGVDDSNRPCSSLTSLLSVANLSRSSSDANGHGSRASAVGTADEEEEETWKPNVWQLGQRSNYTSSATAVNPLPSSESSDYRGWNDAPLPMSDSVVARPYQGGQKRANQRHHRLLHDLAAGLPANYGAASKWARPIGFGDSLPPPPGGPPPSSSYSSSYYTTHLSTTTGQGNGTLKPTFGKLLNDTLRGRISIEAALENALEGVRNVTNQVSSETLNPLDPPSDLHTNQTVTPPPSSGSHELNQFFSSSQQNNTSFRISSNNNDWSNSTPTSTASRSSSSTITRRKKE